MTRILIVEDHRFFSEALRTLLGRRLSEEHGEDPEFRLAATLADGLRIADREGPFDVTIVDLMLPDGDGTEVVLRIKASYPEMRVAVLSSVLDLSGALEAGRTRRWARPSPCKRRSRSSGAWPRTRTRRRRRAPLTPRLLPPRRFVESPGRA
jgi:CheY-like chemotaxis protein